MHPQRLDPTATMRLLHEQLADDARASASPAVRARMSAGLDPIASCIVDLTAAEVRNFDVQRAIGLAIRGEVASAGGHECAVMAEVAAMRNDRLRGHRAELPWQVLCRDLAVGTGTAGGFMVGTSGIAPRNTMFPMSACIQAGAQVLVGLRDSVIAPRFTTVGTGQWLTNEQTAATETSPLTGATTMTARNFAGYAEMSRQWLRQTGGGDLVLQHLQRVAAAALDAAALGGPGTAGAPTGITAWSGVGTVTGTSLGVAGVLEFQTDAATVGDPQSFSYVTTPTVATLLAQRVGLGGTGAAPLWDGPVVSAGARMAGRPGFATVNCPTGVLVGGDFAELAIGLWGAGLSLDFNPYANFSAGIVGAGVFMNADIAVLVPGAFSISTAVT